MQSDQLFLHIISREQARALGMKKYFTGEACLNGGVAPRIVSSYQCLCDACVDKVATKQAAYREANAEKLAAKRADYRAANPKKFAARDAAYCAANAERVAERKSVWRLNNREKIAAQGAIYRTNNSEKIASRKAAYYVDNREKVAAKSAAWRAKNSKQIFARVAAWHAANPQKIAAIQSRRRARKLSAVPVWAGEMDNFCFEEAADLARLRQQATGIDWHVDHMIPLQARDACGLHCASNLQVIPARLNLKKFNKMVLTQPNEWLSHL